MPRSTSSRFGARLALTATLVPSLILAGPAAYAPAQDADAGSMARSPHGMVVTGSPLASAVGARVLEAGGNAVDAAVAAAFALAVVEPSMSGLGGRTQILLRMADGRVDAVDGTTEVPAAYEGGPTAEDDAYGVSTIAVPGTVAALAEALDRHGTWALPDILAPAMALAADGFELPTPEAARIAAAADRLSEFEGSRRHFLRPDGSPYPAGARFRQPALAATLATVAREGADAFYRGGLAGIMATELGAAGSLVAAEDLARYRAEDALVVRGEYRGHELIGSYLPASGATTIEILQILDRFELAGTVGSAAWGATLAHALVAGFEDRATVVEPAATKAAWLTSATRADERAAGIRAALSAPPREPPSTPAAHEPEHTTHLSVADRHGNVVALTQSIGSSMGSKVASPELGFLYAATMEYLGELEPGTRRHWSSQSPLLVTREDRPVLVLGAAGARRIISGIVATVSRVLDGGLSLDLAMAAPRLHPVSGRIDLEDRPGVAWSPAQVDSVGAFGAPVATRDDAPYFARLHAIAFDAAEGDWVGVADPRWHGSARAPATVPADTLDVLLLGGRAMLAPQVPKSHRRCTLPSDVIGRCPGGTPSVGHLPYRIPLRTPRSP